MYRIEAHAERKNKMCNKRLVVSITLLFIVFFIIQNGLADIISWVDENGVRHFSNVGGDGEKQNVEAVKEYNSTLSEERTKSERDRFGVLKMYENDRKKYQEKEKKALIERMKREEAASKKAAEIRMEKIRNEIKKGMEEERKIDARLKKR